LSERDHLILEFAARYRAITADMVEERYFQGSATRVNAARVLRRLVGRGLLRKVLYFPPRSYFAPTARGNRAIGSPDFPPRPLTEQSLPAALAIAWYCVHAKVEQFTDREFRETHPELWRPALKSSSYYRKHDADRLVLGFFLIDRGGAPRRIKRKIRRIVAQRRSIPEFSDLIRARRFRVTVLSGLESQKAAVRKQLGCNSYRRVHVETAFVRELGELLTSS
jgi:hypothetical protein